ADDLGMHGTGVLRPDRRLRPLGDPLAHVAPGIGAELRQAVRAAEIVAGALVFLRPGGRAPIDAHAADRIGHALVGRRRAFRRALAVRVTWSVTAAMRFVPAAGRVLRRVAVVVAAPRVRSMASALVLPMTVILARSAVLPGVLAGMFV